MKFYPTGLKNPIPEELRQARQWVCWQYEYDKRRSKPKKVPIDPVTGKHASTTDPATWGSYDEACAYASDHHVDGVGFVFTSDDPFCGVDLDDCRDPETGTMRLGADEVLDSLGSYAEVSPSGTGIKVFIRAVKQGERCSTKETPWGGKIEIYDQERFFAITGNVYRDDPIREAQETIDDLYVRFLGEDGPKDRTGVRTSCEGFPGHDEALLVSARNNPKTGGLFRKLYDEGDNIPVGERSEVDQALCGMLAYWCGDDPVRIKRLFLGSKLAQGKYAEKGPHGEKYLDGTIRKAIRNRTGTYDSEYGDRMKAMVSEIVSAHRAALSEYGLPSNERLVLDYMLHLADEHGRLRDGRVEFNANQEEIAGVVGISQRGVSKIIQRLTERGLLIRIRKGRKGKNSGYCLPEAITNNSITYVQGRIACVYT
jgi:putative DNA primase/helicase